MAPVAGMPPKNGTTILATPCAISSVFELWRSPMTPSATIADSNDSIAPNMAMVNATGSSCCTVTIRSVPASSCGTRSDGSPDGKLYKSAMVLIESTPAYRFSSQHTKVMMMIATNDPGIFFEINGVSTIIRMVPMPTANAAQLMSDRCAK